MPATLTSPSSRDIYFLSISPVGTTPVPYIHPVTHAGIYALSALFPFSIAVFAFSSSSGVAPSAPLTASSRPLTAFSIFSRRGAKTASVSLIARSCFRGVRIHFVLTCYQGMTCAERVRV